MVLSKSATSKTMNLLEINFILMGTNPNNNRGTAYNAMDISSMNSIINSGTDMSTSFTYQQYSGWTPLHYVRAMVFFDREITLTEMEALHNHYRTNWLAAGGTMPTWGN